MIPLKLSKIKRTLEELPFWTDWRTFSEFEAYFDMTVNADNGHLDWSISFMEKRWKWTRQKVRSFLKKLEREGLILKQLRGSTTHLTTHLATQVKATESAAYTDEQHREQHTQQHTQLKIEGGDNASILIGQNPDEKNKLNFDLLLQYINKKTGRDFQLINNSVRQKFNARLRDGYSKTQIMTAIDNAIEKDYHKENGYQHLTPEFFSRASTLDKYGTKTKKVQQTMPKFKFNQKKG